MADGVTLPDVNVSASKDGFDLGRYLSAQQTKAKGEQAKIGEGSEASISTLRSTEKERESLSPPPPPPQLETPQYKDTSPLSGWGALAIPIAAFASAFTRQPLTGAFNSLAQVNKAYQAGDTERYNMEWRNFEAQRDYAHQLHNYQMDFYRDTLDRLEKKEKGALAEWMVKARAIKDNAAIEAYETGGVPAVLAMYKSSEAAWQKEHSPENQLALDKHRDEQSAFLSVANRWGHDQSVWPQEAWDAYHKMRDTKVSSTTESGLEGGKTDVDRQAMDILQQRAKDRGTTVEELAKDPKERMTARTEAAGQMGEFRSPGVMLREQQQADTVVANLDEIDKVLGLMDRSMTVGIGGMVMRPVESMENLLKLTDDTTRRQVESEISLIKMTAARLLTNRAIVTNREFNEIDKIVRGMHMGDTIQNTKSSLTNLQKFIIQKNRSMLNKFGYGDTVKEKEAIIGDTPTSPTEQAPPDKPWLGAPLVPGQP